MSITSKINTDSKKGILVKFNGTLWEAKDPSLWDGVIWDSLPLGHQIYAFGFNLLYNQFTYAGSNDKDHKVIFDPIRCNRINEFVELFTCVSARA